MKTINTISLYKAKTLGVRNYKSDKQRFLVEDFLSLDILGPFLDEVDTGESDITPAGIAFIKEYYGFGELAKELITAKALHESIKNLSAEELTRWLENLYPMQISRFISAAQGNNVATNNELAEEFLPPKRDS